MSQPSVTQAIKQLESWVGILLLDRTQRPTQATKAGWILHEAIRSGFNGIIGAIDEISWLKNTNSRSCTIAAPIGFATHWLMPYLNAFNVHYPSSPVNVLSTYEAIPLLNPRIDIAIRFGSSLQAEDGQSDHLFHERIQPVCSPLLAQKIQQEKIDFEDVSLIHVEYNDDRWTGWDEYLQMIGRPKRGHRGGLSFTNYVQAAQATLDGRGCMLGWRSISHIMVQEGRLIPIFGKEIVARDSFFLIRKFGERPEAVDLLADWLLKKGKETDSITCAARL